MTHTFLIAQIFRTDQGCIICTGDVSAGTADHYGNFLHTPLYVFSRLLMLLSPVFYIWLDKILSKFSVYETNFKVMFRSENSETRQISYVQMHAIFVKLEYLLSILCGISLTNSVHHASMIEWDAISSSMKLQNLYDIAWHACWEHEQRFEEVSLSDFVHIFYLYSLFVYGILATCPRF